MRLRSAIPVVCGLLIVACAPDAEQATEEMAEQEYESAGTLITALAGNYEQHYNLGHASMVADLYTDEAIVLGANSAVSKGREAIIAAMEGFMAAYSPALSIHPAEQLEVGEWVVDRGSYRQELSPEGGNAVALTGNYLSLSRRTEDGLRLHRLAVNGSAPPPIPLPGPEMVETEAMSGGPIADLIASYAEHYNMGHAAMVADMWTEDGVAMFAESPAASGRAAIETALAELIAAASPQLTIMDAETIMIGDGLAVDRGHFTVATTVEGETVTRSGTYMVLCRESDDGTWRLHWGLSNFAPLM